MKVVIFNTLYYPTQIGGAEKSVQILAEALVANGVEPVVITASDTRGTYNHNGVRVITVPVKNIYPAYKECRRKKFLKPLWHVLDTYNPLVALEIRRILQIENPDIVHTNNLSRLSIAAWTEAVNDKIPVIHSIRDYWLLCPNSKMFKRGGNCAGQCFSCKVFGYPRKLASMYVTHVVGISRFVLDAHIKAGYFSNAEQHVIPNSVEAPSIVSSRKRETVTIGYIGTIAEYKGIDILVEAILLINNTNFAVLIAGEGDREYIKHVSDRLANCNVSFCGRVNPNEFFQSIDVLVVPPLWNEPFGRTVIEAYSYGVPVIAAKSGGLLEIVEEGRTGFLYEPNDHKTLAQKIECCIGFKLRIRNEDLISAANNFSSKRVNLRYVQLYTQIQKGILS